ncbi:MAG TPA: UvrD-helicase domain-containing protein [Myxococcales bacterium]|nr:UvrD-helicase domain-containing protein [Myxococcales bacterium]
MSPNFVTRLEEQLEILARARVLLPQSKAPYSAHIRLRYADGRESDFLLGAVFRRGEGLTILDWRTAPLAEVFFAYAEGEEYEIDLGDRKLAGKVLRRNLVRFEDGELQELQWPQGALRRLDGRWIPHTPPLPPRLLPRPHGQRARPASPVEVELDPAQRAVVELPPGETVLILGEAGCGKTTVALHRLRALRLLGNERFRAACVVPNEGLRRLIESLLHRLGLDDVETWTLDKFASKQARRVFPDLRRRESEDTPTLVSRLKRHEALRVALEAIARRPPAAPENEGGRRARLATREDLHALYGDRPLMDEVEMRAALPASAGQVVEHTRVQFTQSTEREYAYVDADRLVAVDGRTIDEGTPTGNAETVDVEDYAVIFELERLRAKNAGVAPASPSRYHCLLVDEAQELSPLELSLLGRCVSRGGTLIVAGDSAQQVDETVDFRGWDQTMLELGAAQHRKAVLEVSYRCPPEVTAFARALREPAGAAAFPLARFHDECHLAAWLVEALRELDAEDPTAASAVICRTPQAAALLARVARMVLPAHLALEGAFTFGPGAQVTCVPEVKGLEFDHVVIPDVAAGRYADTLEARRALYVAATRASSQLLLATPSTPSPLIRHD